MTRPERTFLPDDLDATNLERVEGLVRALLARRAASREDVERWVRDRSDLSAACSEALARLYIAMTCNTSDGAAQAAYLAYIEHVQPRLTELNFELDKKAVALDAEHPLAPERYGVLMRNLRADVAIFRPENVPIETELGKLGQQYDQITGAMTVTFDGQEQPMARMARYQEVTDRAVREGAWRAVAERRAGAVDAIDGIYTDMVTLRDRLARNAGFENYVGYAFEAMHRFDYGPEACVRFHDGVERAIVPLVRALEAERRRKLGVEALRPWDLSVDVKGRGPLRPFEGGADLVRKSRSVFRRMDAGAGGLAAMYERMGDGDGRVRSAADAGVVCFDLDSRAGKAPGGYQYMLDRSNRPFIFMNAAGMQRDVETMMHEAGHAFHSMLCEHEPLVEYRHSPIEFAEVASMSMELLTMGHWGGGSGGGFYESEEDLARATRDLLRNSVQRLPWIALIDAFQHWVYANPRHTRDERRNQFLALDERFGSSVSWEGLEAYRPNLWQRQLHLFGHPFYYIEYGIAQLGALQLWVHALEKGEASALAAYKRALSLGGSRPLPELFAAAGLEFDFGPETVRRLAERVGRELERIPE